MALQLGTTLRNALLDQIETTVGTTPYLQIRSGSPPSDCSQADSGTLLCEIHLPSEWAANASSGSKALAGSWTDTGVAAGTAAHFRLKDNGKTTTHMQGTVTATGGGGDMTLDNAVIAVGQTVTVNSFTLSAGNA